MEGEFKVRAVEFEEKSVAEKEAALLEGLEDHSGDNDTIKVDLTEGQPVVETVVEDQSQEVDLDDNKVLSYLGKRWNKEITSLDELVEQRTQAEELPEDVSAFL